MTIVKELIKALQKEDGDRIVIVASDPEGNHTRPLGCLTSGCWTGGGDIYIEKLTPRLEKAGFTENEVGSADAKPALVLWP